MSGGRDTAGGVCGQWTLSTDSASLKHRWISAKMFQKSKRNFTWHCNDKTQKTAIDSACFVPRQYSHKRTTENLQDCEILSKLSASRGSRFPLAFVVETGNQGLAKRLGWPPYRPVWSGAAVQAPKEGRSREATTRGIKELENVRSAIIWAIMPPSHTSFGPRFLHQCPSWPKRATFGCLDGWSYRWRCSQSVSTNAAKSQSQASRVPNVRP